MTFFPDSKARRVPKLAVWSDRNDAGEVRLACLDAPSNNRPSHVQARPPRSHTQDLRSTHTVDFDPTKLGQVRSHQIPYLSRKYKKSTL